jgi:AraC-like DNA-binding protein
MGSRTTAAARDALGAQFTRPPTLEALAQIAGVSVSHLTHSFRRHFRQTPGEYVCHVRVH